LKGEPTFSAGHIRKNPATGKHQAFTPAGQMTGPEYQNPGTPTMALQNMRKRAKKAAPEVGSPQERYQKAVAAAEKRTTTKKTAVSPRQQGPKSGDPLRPDTITDGQGRVWEWKAGSNYRWTNPETGVTSAMSQNMIEETKKAKQTQRNSQAEAQAYASAHKEVLRRLERSRLGFGPNQKRAEVRSVSQEAAKSVDKELLDFFRPEVGSPQDRYQKAVAVAEKRPTAKKTVPDETRDTLPEVEAIVRGRRIKGFVGDIDGEFNYIDRDGNAQMVMPGGFRLTEESINHQGTFEQQEYSPKRAALRPERASSTPDGLKPGKFAPTNEDRQAVLRAAARFAESKSQGVYTDDRQGIYLGGRSRKEQQAIRELADNGYLKRVSYTGGGTGRRGYLNSTMHSSQQYTLTDKGRQYLGGMK
jgi:hypothetical protein